MRKNNIHLEPSMGKILIAEPFILDSYFKRAVVLLGEHDEDGTVGFILNKPTDLTINDGLEDFPQFNVPLYFGGPVDMKLIHYLHTLGEKLEGAKEILPGIYWGGNLEVLKLLIETRQLRKEDIRFFAGHSGWEPNQLSTELRTRKTWVVAEGKKDFAFAKNPEDLWGEVLRLNGDNHATLSNFPDDPSLN